MHNNKKKLVRSLAAMLLALAMALPLTACQVEIPGMGTININDGASDGDTAKTNGGEPEAYDDSLDLAAAAAGRASAGRAPRGGLHRRYQRQPE